jgi:hypothetical protein
MFVVAKNRTRNVRPIYNKTRKEANRYKNWTALGHMVVVCMGMSQKDALDTEHQQSKSEDIDRYTQSRPKTSAILRNRNNKLARNQSN